VLDPRWKDKVLIRDPMASGTMRAIWGLILVRSLRETGDTSRGMAWLRRLDGQTKAYTLNPAILDARLARAELVTLWDLPDILIGRAARAPVRLCLPAAEDGGHRRRDRSGAGQPPSRGRSGVHRLRRQQQAAQLLAAERCSASRSNDLPPDRVPAWVAEVEREMAVIPMDWELLSREGAAWMGYWDRHVRGTGKDGAE
jgi:iron(III) transport system substrate-binding protein